MNLKEATRILVLDTIHGAEIIAEELKGLGKQAEVFDPYHQTFSKALDYDLVIAPVHLNPNFEVVKQALKMEVPFMSHHKAVKEIASLKNLFSDTKVVEVTGTVGKTAVCELICQLLKNKNAKVLSHTSSVTRFQSAGEEVQFPRIGGAPANVLKVMRIASEKKLKPEIAVFEISLGLTGIGDVGVITSLEADYRIAGGTKDASAAKIASIQNYADEIEGRNRSSAVIVLPDSFAEMPENRKNELKGFRFNTNFFGATAKAKSLWLDDTEHKVFFDGLKTVNGDSVSGGMKFNFEAGFYGDYYRNSLEASFCTVLSLGIPPERVNTDDISAVRGRLKVENRKGRFLIDNSNSGTKLTFLDEITEMARRYSDRMTLIVGVESEYVCEGVNEEELKEVVANATRDFIEIIIVGAEFKDKIEGKTVFFSDTLDAALEKAVSDSEEGSVIISNVKTWR
ncbi:MAG: coenzyme F430 synthase [Halobacteriota archaeon]